MGHPGIGLKLFSFIAELVFAFIRNAVWNHPKSRGTLTSTPLEPTTIDELVTSLASVALLQGLDVKKDPRGKNAVVASPLWLKRPCRGTNPRSMLEEIQGNLRNLN